MKIYAISDLHLSLCGDKPMDIFGEKWGGYLEKIEYDWNSKVSETDVVLISGDISWAMQLENALIDLEFLNRLKGTKIIIRGNHDYWWQSISRLREKLPSNVIALQNDAVKIGDYIFCGSRGWTVEGSPEFTEQDVKLYNRETERFRLALKNAEKLRLNDEKLIALIHYPPFNIRRENSNFTALFEEFKVNKVVYGHLHGRDAKPYYRINKNGIEYILASCDLVDNKLVEVY